MVQKRGACVSVKGGVSRTAGGLQRDITVPGHAFKFPSSPDMHVLTKSIFPIDFCNIVKVSTVINKGL